MQSALAFATSSLPLWKASPFTFLFASKAATMSWYFQPTCNIDHVISRIETNLNINLQQANAPELLI